MDVPDYNVMKKRKQPWELRKHNHKPAITRLRRAGTVSFDDMMRPLSEYVTVTKKPRRKRGADRP